MIYTKGYAANRLKGLLESWNFERRELGARDMEISILYCGVCQKLKFIG